MGIELGYTTVVFADKKRTGLPFPQYAFCDAVYHLSNNELRWCYAKHKQLAELFDVDDRTIRRWLKQLTGGGWIEKHPETGHIRTTGKWYESVISSKQGEQIEADKMSAHRTQRPDEMSAKRTKCPVKSGEEADKMSGVLYKDDSNNIIPEKKKISDEVSSPPKRQYKNPYCSTRWYLEEFCPIFEQHSGRVPLARGKEFGQADKFFKALANLNPDSPPEEIYRRATEGVGLFFLALAGRVDEFGWIRECPADIGWFMSNAAKIDQVLRKREAMTDEEIDREQRIEESLTELGEIERRFDEDAEHSGKGAVINGSGISITGSVN